MWAEPQLEPVYQAVRSYLEMDQRVTLLQERVGVVGDLLAVLKDQLSHTHGMFGPLLPCFPTLSARVALLATARAVVSIRKGCLLTSV